MCRPCFNENPELAEYNCKICTDPISLNNEPVLSGTRCFGTELEVEITGDGENNSVQKHIRRIDALLGEKVLMKKDGSLAFGFEITTRPAPIQKQYAIWNKFFSVKHRGLRSYDTNTCGLHFHVNRDSLTEHAIAKIVCFINAEQNKKFIFCIAGRTEGEYCKIKNKTIGQAHVYEGDRHEAVNLSNGNTIEFRIFRGTLKKESLFKAMEFCDAICDYCKQGESLEQSISRTGFVRFVKKQNKWPHLFAFIQARWYGIATELSEQAKWKVTKNCRVPDEASLVLGE
jgi:hypothetical protein